MSQSQTNGRFFATNCRLARSTSRPDISAAESYFRRKRNSVPIAAMAWLSNT
jgi:hypothetical protein